MFFCEPCREKRDWPESIFKSYGKCEMCDKRAECNDVPSKYLASSKVMPKLRPKPEYVGKHRKP